MNSTKIIEFASKIFENSGAVIAAIITGVLALIGIVFKSTKESKMSHITGERTKWREQIRKVACEISTIDFNEMNSDQRNTLTKNLTILKMRLNSFGNNDNDKSKKRYLKDSHIWNSISILEDKNKSNKALKKERDKLISYLSLLLKFDWERSKIESSINIASIFGYSLFIVSNFLMIYFAYTEFEDTNLKELIELILLFTFVFIIPYLSKFIADFLNLTKNWIDYILSYGIPISYYIFLLYEGKTDSKFQIGSMDLPISLLIIALIFLAVSKYKEYKNISNYQRSVKQIDSNKNKTNAVKSNVIIIKVKNSKNANKK